MDKKENEKGGERKGGEEEESEGRNLMEGCERKGEGQPTRLYIVSRLKRSPSS